jgi:hypothetical protein
MRSKIELGNHHSICSKAEENQENACRMDGEQGIPEKYLLS